MIFRIIKSFLFTAAISVVATVAMAEKFDTWTPFVGANLGTSITKLEVLEIYKPEFCEIKLKNFIKSIRDTTDFRFFFLMRVCD